MSPFPQVFQFLVVAVAGWINQQPRDVIDSLQEEHRVLREQRGPGRLRVTDAQRRRLAAQAKRLGRRGRRDRHTLVTPDTLLRWHRQLIARPYAGVGARMRAGLRASNRRARHLPMRYETGLPSSVIRFSTLHASTASRRCPDELRARRQSPTIDVYRKNAFSTRAC